jgi:hypothetical protein
MSDVLARQQFCPAGSRVHAGVTSGDATSPRVHAAGHSWFGRLSRRCRRPGPALQVVLTSGRIVTVSVDCPQEAAAALGQRDAAASADAD